jgi:TPR repeat protein
LSGGSSLRWYSQRQSSIAFFIAALVLAVAGVLQKLLPYWAFLSCASVVAAAGVVFTRLQQIAAKRDAQTATLRNTFIGTTKDGSLPRAKDVSYESLGILSFSDDIPYLERAVEREAAEVLRNGKPLLIVGSGLSGKSRLAAELIRRAYTEREVLIPVGAAQFLDFLKSLNDVRRFVVWLDDLDRYLISQAFDRQCIRNLADNDNAIIATIDEQSFGSLRGHGISLGCKASVLQCFEIVHLRNRRRENMKHSLSFEHDKDAEIVKMYGVAGFAGGLPLVRQALTVARISDPRAFTLLRTIYHWQETGLGWIHQDRLISLMNDPQGRGREASTPSEIQDILASFDGPPSMPKIIEQNSGFFRLPSHVRDFLNEYESSVPSKVWDAALETACIHDLPLLGHLALAHYRNKEVADRAWRRAAEADDGYSMWNLGMMLERVPARRDEGIQWLRQAAASGYTDSYETFGVTLLRKNMREEGIHWLQKAANEGNTSAMVQLGHLFEREKAGADALWWYERAAKNGSQDADFKIAQFLRRNGRRDAADRILEQSRDPRAILALVMIGIDAYRRGEVEVAKGKFLIAAANKSALALRELALAYLDEGDIRAAADNYRQAVSFGDACAKTGLGYIAMEFLGDKTLAEQWFGEASQYGCGWAMCYLGFLCEDEGDDETAEFWYRGSARRGNIEGMYQLGLMLEGKFDYKAAARWYRKAGQRGHVVAISNLVEMLASQGLDDEAKQWSNRVDYMVAEAPIGHLRELPPPPSCGR